MVRRNYVKSPILEVGSKAEYGINLVEIRDNDSESGASRERLHRNLALVFKKVHQQFRIFHKICSGKSQITHYRGRSPFGGFEKTD